MHAVRVNGRGSAGVLSDVTWLAPKRASDAARLVRFSVAWGSRLIRLDETAAVYNGLTVVMICLRGGRVVDPQSGFDAVADVLVADGHVGAVGRDLHAPEGTGCVDVSGCIVGPGFVDVHSHVHSIAGQRLQALDGVTTALDLEAGLMPVERAYALAAAEGRPLHYGFSASWGAARAQVLLGWAPDASFQSMLAAVGEPRWQVTSTPAQRLRWLQALERELGDGALGIGVLLGYAPNSDPAEFTHVARLAAAAGAPTFTHVREIVEADPSTPIDGSFEIVRAAAETGAAMHHCHVNSTSRRHLDRVLDLIERSRAEGSQVSVETYPYGAGATSVGAAFLAPERLGAWGLRPSNIIEVSTGRRLADEAELRRLRATQPDSECMVEFLDEREPSDRALLHRALAFPDSIVASDAMPVSWPDGTHESVAWPLPPGGRTHPRTAGTFARSLRTMVRESGAWDWSEAFRRCSSLPAQLLHEVAPAARGKGHLAVGADADIVVLEPDTVTDTATYSDPTRVSRGVRHLLVDGIFVVRDGELQREALPGRPVRGEPR